MPPCIIVAILFVIDRLLWTLSVGIATRKKDDVVEFSKVEFLERAKAEKWGMCSLGSVGEQYDRQLLLIWAFFED